MKIDDESASTSNVYPDMPPASAKLLRNIKNAKTVEEFIAEINKGREVHSVMGKTELCRWVEVLNRLDEILEKGVEKNEHSTMKCDYDPIIRKQVIDVVRFTVLLFESTSSRRVYRSLDHILDLLETTDMDILGEVLRLLQTMGKRSKFLTTRVGPAEQKRLASHLTAIAQCWGGKLRSVKMAECVKKEPNIPALFPFTFTDGKQRTISIEKPTDGSHISELVKDYMAQLTPPTSLSTVSDHSPLYEDRYRLLSSLRMLNNFEIRSHRFKCLVTRLLSVSTLIYCRCQSDENPVSALLHNGFVDELVAILKAEKESECVKEYQMLDQIHTESLSTLCSIVNYEKEPKIPQILEALSAGSYHGYLSVLTRHVVEELKQNNLGKPGKPSVFLATALFSFIYHLASIEPGGDTLVGSGLTQTLLSVIGYHELPIEFITFGTRCARIIDLFTTIDVAAFKAHNGMEICVNRIVHEIKQCREEQPFMIDTSYDMPWEEEGDEEEEEEDSDGGEGEGEFSDVGEDMDQTEGAAASEEAAPPAVEKEKVEENVKQEPEIKGGPWVKSPHTGLTCHQQRSGLIKGLLTFVKRAIQDAQFNDVIRIIMDNGMPEALMHILSNSEYYSPSLFHQSAQLITNYVFQMPEELKVLQRMHVPYVLLQSLLRKELPNSRDVISTIGNVFSAMCINARGLKQFKTYEPFDQTFRILLSVKFLVSMKKKRTEMSESALSIGSALDDLLRQYPELKQQMLQSILNVLDRLVSLGQNPPQNVEVVMQLAKHIARSVMISSSSVSHQPEPIVEEIEPEADEDGDIPMEEDYENELEEESDADEEAEMSMDEMSGEGIVGGGKEGASSSSNRFKYSENDVGLEMICDDGTGKKILPLGDYMIITAKILETMMTQNANLRMIDEFVQKDGIEKMLALCQLPCLNTEISQTHFPQSIANIVKFIAFQRNSESGPRLMKSILAVFHKTMSPVFEKPSIEFPSINQAEEDNKPASASMMKNLGERKIHTVLTNLNNILPVLTIISKNALGTQMQTEMKQRVLETWKTPEGVKVYDNLRKLARMLVWESALIRVLKPQAKNCATQTDPAEVGEDGMLVSHEETFNAATDSASERKEPKEKQWVLAGINQEEHDFWTNHKQLADLVMRTNRNVNEMLNLIAKSITVMPAVLRRVRRTAGNPLGEDNSPHCASMIFSAIYKDLQWVHKCGDDSPMANYRYTDLLQQISAALFDERERVNPYGVVQQFYASGCHRAVFELFSEKLVAGMVDGPQQASLEDVVLEWCRLAGRLAHRQHMTYQQSEAFAGRPMRGPNEFEINKYMRLIYRDLFRAFTCFFEKMSAKGRKELRSYSSIFEIAFGVFKEVVKNINSDDEQDRKRAAEAAEEVEMAAAAAVAPAVVDVEREAPIDQEQVNMLMEMGFDREFVILALERSNNPEEAVNYLIARGLDAVFPPREEQVAPPNPIPEVRDADEAFEQVGGEVPVIPLEQQEERQEDPVPEIKKMSASATDKELMDALGTEAKEALKKVIDENLSLKEELETIQMDEEIKKHILAVYERNCKYGSTSEAMIFEGIRSFIRGDKIDSPDEEDNIATPLIPPLSQLKIDSDDVSLQSACEQLMPLLKILLPVSLDMLFSCSDLVTCIFPAMGEQWKKEKFVKELLTDEVIELCTRILSQPDDISLEPAKNLASRLHFACVMFDQLSTDYIEIAKSSGMVGHVLELLGFCDRKFADSPDFQNTLLSRTILWLDLYDKNHRTISRRKHLQSITPTLNWSYLGDSQEEALGLSRRRSERKWSPYPESVQKEINEAYFGGRRDTSFSISRHGRQARRVRLDFSTMEQSDHSSVTDLVKGEIPDDALIDFSKLLESEAQLTWTSEENERLVVLSVQLLQKTQFAQTTAHSLLSFISRLTNNAKNAEKFMELGGIEYAVRLRGTSTQTFKQLVSVIISNCIDDDSMMAYVFEKAIRKAAAPVHKHSMAIFESSNQPTTKPRDWYVTLNRLMPLSSRNPTVFLDVAEKILKINGNSVQVVPIEKEKPKTEAGQSTSTSSAPKEAPEANEKVKSVIKMLLNEVLHGEFAKEARVLNKDQILLLVAEIVLAHPPASILVVEAQEKDKSVLLTLLEEYIQASADRAEVASALKTLIAVVASCPNAKAQDLIVQDVRGALHTFCEKAQQIGKEKEGNEQALAEEKCIANKISELCGVIITMCRSCASPEAPANDGKLDASGKKVIGTCSILKVFHKKRMCTDLVKAITYLRLGEKESIDTINEVLKTLEVLMEGLIQPAAQAAHAVNAAAAGARTAGRMEVGISTNRENNEQRREEPPEGRAFLAVQLPRANADAQQVVAQQAAEDEDVRDDEQEAEDDGNRWRHVRMGGMEPIRRLLEEADDDDVDEDEEEEEEEEVDDDAARELNEQLENFMNGIGYQLRDGEGEGSEDSLSESSNGNYSDQEESEGNEEGVRDDAVEVGNGEIAVEQAAPGAQPEQPQVVQHDQMEVVEGNDEEEENQEEDEHIENDVDGNEEEDDDDDDQEEDDDNEDDEEEDDADEQAENQAMLRLANGRNDDGHGWRDFMHGGIEDVLMEDDFFNHIEPMIRTHHARIRRDELQHDLRLLDMIPQRYPFPDIMRHQDWDPLLFDRRHRAGGNGPQHPLLARPAPNDAPINQIRNIRGPELVHVQPRFLHRQNAIRRNGGDERGGDHFDALARSYRAHGHGEFAMGNAIASTSGMGGRIGNTFRDPMGAGLFERILDFSTSHGGTGGRHLRAYFTSDGPADEGYPSRLNMLQSYTDRINAFVHNMDPISIRFVSVIVNTILTRDQKLKEEKEKEVAEAKAKAKKEQEEKEKKKKAEEEAAKQPKQQAGVEPPTTGTTNTVSEAVAPSSRNDGEETSTTQATESGIVVVGEVVANVEAQDEESRFPASSAATAASSVAGVEELLEDEAIAVAEAAAAEANAPQGQNPREQEEQEASNVEIPQPPQQEQAPAAAPRQEIPEEFRAILGDMEVPDGVDVTFLAALPEEMRQEVLRDYRRQQRAERAARPIPELAEAVPANNEQAAVGGAAEGEQAAAAAPGAEAVPLIEPINPEFLNALPPELQEEVLAEHERRVREAQDAQRRANAPPEPVPDGAAVIASLPANERAQVLAEMDDAELAELPQNMQDEARRIRSRTMDPHVLRYHRLLFRRNGRPAATAGIGVRPGTHNNGGPTIGKNAGTAQQASATTPSLLDREAIVTLCLLYLMDKLALNRLQRVMRIVCMNSQTCDFVIWCLLALLDKASETNADEEEIVSNVPAWLESIIVSGVGHNERALRIGENASKVSIHSMVSVPLCRTVLDLLAALAKSYPGNFIPVALRKDAKPTDVGKQWPSFDHFWQMVQSNQKMPMRKDYGASTSEQQLDECAMGQLMMYLRKPIVQHTGQLQDRIMKVVNTIMQTVPNNSIDALGVKDVEYLPLKVHLTHVIDSLTRGGCSNEGLSDGLNLIAEAMRTFPDQTSKFIYDHLFSAVGKLGEDLLPQIRRLIDELDEAQKSDESGPSSPRPDEQGPSKTQELRVDVRPTGIVAHGRFDGQRMVIDGEQNTRLMMSSCKELQLPAVTVLTNKAGSQYQLLSSLHTLVKVRNHMRLIRKEKRRAAKEAEKKKKEQEEVEVNVEEGASTPVPVAVAAAEQQVAVVGEAVKKEEPEEEEIDEEPRISERLAALNPLWDSLSDCLVRLGKASDPHAVLALQPAAEAFFLVHASQKVKKDEAAKRKESEAQQPGAVMATSSVDALQGTSSRHEDDPDTVKLVEFAEKHRQVLNQALRQNNAVLSTGGPFSVLTRFPKLLDFDVKRKFFRKELTRSEPYAFRRNDVSVQVHRNRVFSDSFRELFRLRPAEWKSRFYIIFHGEEGQDAGGLLREWFSVITREIFNPNYALFITAPGDMVTYMINKASYINPEHLDYFKFVGRLIAKSVYEHKYLDCYFTRAFYKHILNLPVRYQDLESEDPAFFKSLEFLLQNPIDDLGLDLTFSTEVEEFGVRSVRDLKPNGRQIEVNDANKEEYVKLVCQMKMTGSIRQQLDAFLQGFYEIIPKDLIEMFNEQELELLISGLPTVDIDDLAANTDYKGYQKTSVQIQWFWRALKSFEKEDKAKFLQFVTGTSKVPLQGFSSLEGMNGTQKFSIHMDSRGGDRLPAAHTCFNQLDLPQYESFEKLRDSLLLAIRECTEGFGFA